MSDTIQTNKPGRPRSNSTPITVSLSPSLTARMDAVRELHPDKPTRQDFVRHALSAYLANIEAVSASPASPGAASTGA